MGGNDKSWLFMTITESTNYTHLNNNNNNNNSNNNNSYYYNNRSDWNHFNITQTIPEQHESTKLSNYEKQPYWALHTNYRKC